MHPRVPPPRHAAHLHAVSLLHGHAAIAAVLHAHPAVPALRPAAADDAAAHACTIQHLS
jgi:hypothetical protein